MVRQASSLRDSLTRKNRKRLLCELLEDRNLLNCGPAGTVLENFDSGDLSAYQTIVNYYPTAIPWEGAGCDGGTALVDYDGDDWIIRADAGSRVAQGEGLSAWVYLGGAADGRAYLGFGSVRPTSYDVNPPPAARPITTGRTLSAVLAPNTNQFQIQMHLGYKFTGSNFSVLGTVNHQFAMDQWYRVEVYWFQGGTIWSVLYDAYDNPLAFVDGQQPGTYPNTAGGLSFRTFGPNSFSIWDSVVNMGPFGGPGGGPIGGGRKLTPVNQPNVTLEAVRSLTRWDTPGVQGVVYPFNYVDAPGTNRDIQLDAISGLSHVACSMAQCPDGTYQGYVGLTIGNTSRNMTNVQVPWGPSLFGHFSNDTPFKSPNFQMFFYRLDPGGEALRIGESGIKAFWSSTDSDYQHIAPFSTDTYSTGHNSNRTSFSTLASLNPYTGERYDYSEMGNVTIHGYHAIRSRTFTDPFENLLKVDAAELDPSTHPGARYFVAANIYVVGDRSVANNSRWLEYRLTSIGQNRYSFTPVGTQQLDICRIPGLAPIGRCGAGSPVGGDDSGLIPDIGQIDVTRVLVQPMAGFTALPIERAPTLQPPMAVAPLEQVFNGQQPIDDAPVSLEPEAVDTLLGEVLDSGF